MFRIVVALLFALPAIAAGAQQSCVCTSGCTVVSDPYPPGADQPTSCRILVGGVTVIASSPVVLSSSIATSNAARCTPASATYNPGVAGSVACSGAIPAQAAGTTVSVTMDAINGAGESAPSSALTFQSVSALPIFPKVPVNPRVQ